MAYNPTATGQTVGTKNPSRLGRVYGDLELTDVGLRSFSNRHYLLCAKYYDDQKLGNETKYQNGGHCVER